MLGGETIRVPELVNVASIRCASGLPGAASASMLQTSILDDKDALGRAAAERGGAAIREAIAAHGAATIVLATGISQFEMLAHLVALPDIDWRCVTAFHLDEYVGLSARHPASFQGYLRQRFAIPLQGAAAFVAIDGTATDPQAEADRLGALIAVRPVDVCFAGIGENCHLAFNDPPADFRTEAPYIVVELDDACRRQQFGEGWFPTLADVPTRAISMSIRQMLKSALIVLSVSDTRKAVATRDALEGDVTHLHPASILQRHPNTAIFLDRPAAALLRGSAPA
jgi:glucosamine-6-phosphate deaminase